MPEAKLSEDRSGSTVVCCFVYSTHIIIANLGDSRAVMYSGRGHQSSVVMATLDHKPVLPKERERIINAGGYVMIQRINGSLAVSRALGDFDYKAVQSIIYLYFEFLFQKLIYFQIITLYKKMFFVIHCNSSRTMGTNGVIRTRFVPL